MARRAEGRPPPRAPTSEQRLPLFSVNEPRAGRRARRGRAMPGAVMEPISGARALTFTALIPLPLNQTETHAKKSQIRKNGVIGEEAAGEDSAGVVVRHGTQAANCSPASSLRASSANSQTSRLLLLRCLAARPGARRAAGCTSSAGSIQLCGRRRGVRRRRHFRPRL